MAKAGPLPAMVPVNCSIDDQTTGRKRSFHVQVANHPLLIGQLAPIAIREAIAEAHPVPDEVLADANLAVDTERCGALKRQKKLSLKREKRAARRPRRAPAPAPAAAAPEQAAATS